MSSGQPGPERESVLATGEEVEVNPQGKGGWKGLFLHGHNYS